jgi:hypothetical protein
MILLILLHTPLVLRSQSIISDFHSGELHNE